MTMTSEGAISRQLAYQRRMIAEGRCSKCGKPRNRSKSLCDEHLDANRPKNRKRCRDQYRRAHGIPLDAPVRASRDGLSPTERIAAGLCYQCGEPRNLYQALCDEHAAKNRDRVRNSYRDRHGIPLDAPLQNVGKRRLA
jgi:predicted amidophosphoribosyltransferase